MPNFLILMLIAVIVFIALIFLQNYLSKQKSKWLGIILPLFTLVVSIITVACSNDFHLDFQSSNGGLTAKNPIVIQPKTIPEMIIAFLFCNIPTIVLLLIYLVKRQEIKKSSEINKMKIQDLD